MIELTRLYQQRPGPGTPTEAVVAWYHAKGRIHELIGRSGGPDSAQELAIAAASYEHARRLELQAGLVHNAAA
ncbi:hypothetical protein [Lentzea sp. NPDC004782]|uniref:hypothetical protein n=1 Tax=Lentzea sp. NPDC004782 TaxID=3154458 RepID=UPI0033B01074